MKAAVFTESMTDFKIEDFDRPIASENMAVVDLVASGICGTDVHIWEGALAIPGPVILGHEFLGKVSEIGPGEAVDCLGKSVAAGDMVAVNVIEPCGECLLCRTGGAASCLKLGESLTYTADPYTPPHFHGGFAEVNVSPTRYLQKMPDTLPGDVAAAFLCAGPTVIRGVKYAGGITKGETVVVQGAGPVGLFATLYAKALGAGTVIMLGSGSNPMRLEIATALGADECIDIKTLTMNARDDMIKDMTDGLGADMIIEGTGSPAAIAEGLGLLRLRGRYIWAGQYSDRGPVELPTHLVTFNALQIFGSAQFTAEDRADYFEFMMHVPEKWDAIKRVVTDRFKVEQADQAMARACSGRGIKTIFVA